MSILFKKKTPKQLEADKKAEEIRFKFETEERLKLAEEHGRADANRKYGKFKQPTIIQKAVNTIGKLQDGQEPRKKKKNLADRASKMFEELSRL
jgi:hypothetical protein